MNADPFALCELTTIEVRTTAGVRKTPAWVYGQLAAHKKLTSDLWGLTHLPSGFGFGPDAIFPSADEAVPAMIEIARLKNGWHLLEWDEATEIGDQIRTIVAKHRGTPGPKPPEELRDLYREDYRNDMNGYAEPPRELPSGNITPEWCKYREGMLRDAIEMRDFERMGLSDMTRPALLAMAKKLPDEFRPKPLSKAKAWHLRRAIRKAKLATPPEPA